MKICPFGTVKNHDYESHGEIQHMDFSKIVVGQATGASGGASVSAVPAATPMTGTPSQQANNMSGSTINVDAAYPNIMKLYANIKNLDSNQMMTELKTLVEASQQTPSLRNNVLLPLKFKLAPIMQVLSTIQ